MNSSRLLLFLVLAGVVGFCIHITLRDKAFRGSSLELKMTQKEALEKSRELLQKQGYSLEGARHSVSFYTYDSPAVYLEKNSSSSQTKEWLKEHDFPIWGWTVRFFWPLEEEEYFVWWNPRGDIAGYQHFISNEKKLPELKDKIALKKASEFLQRHFRDFSKFKLVEQSSEEKPNRTEHYFTWKKENTPLDTRLLLRATVSGNELSAVQKEVELPESFMLSEKKISSTRHLVSNVAQKIDSVLTLAMGLILVWFWSKRLLRRRPAIILAGILGLVQVLGLLNNLPLKWQDYNTTDTIPSFWLSTLSYPVLFLILGSVWAVFQFATSDAVGRTLVGPRYSLGEITSLTFLKSRAFATATVAGFAIAGIQLGFVVLYYFIGNRFFHFYSPNEIQYDDLLTTAIPWIYPLLIGLQPALIEETVYRLFSIPFLLHFTKRKWIALVGSALLWGFLHTTYNVEPIYARGIELTLVGLFFGFIYLRFGIWATMVGHYIYNATVSSSLLLSSNNLYFQVSSAIVIGILLIPFTIAVTRIARKKSFAELNFESLPWPARGESPPVDLDRRQRVVQGPLPLLRPLWLPLVCALIVFLAPVSVWAPTAQVGRTQATQISVREILPTGLQIDRVKVSRKFVESSPDEMVVKYLNEYLPWEKTKLYLERFQPKEPRWKIRFIDPIDATYCDTLVEMTENVRSFDCDISEDQPGIMLTPEDSKKTAENFLRHRGIDLTRMKYAGAIEHSHPHRKDITHQWTDPQAEVEDLRRYLSVRVVGSKVFSFLPYLQIPDSFEHKQLEQTFWQTFREILLGILGVSILFVGIRAIFDRTVMTRLSSRIPLTAAVISFVIKFLDNLNHFPTFWTGFRPASSTQIYIWTKLLNWLGESVLYGIGSYILLLFFLRLPPQLFTDAPSLHDANAIFKRPPWRWRETRSTFTWAIGLISFELILEVLAFWISEGKAGQPFQPDYSAFSTAFPFFDFISQLWDGVLYWLTIAVAFSACRKYLRPWMTYSLLAIFMVVYVSNNQESVLVNLHSLATLFVSAWIVIRYIRFRLPFYVWYTLLNTALPMIVWLRSPLFYFQFNATAVLLTVLLFASLTFVRMKNSRDTRLDPSWN